MNNKIRYRSVDVRTAEFTVRYKYNLKQGVVKKLYTRDNVTYYSPICYNKSNVSSACWSYIVYQLRKIISKPTAETYYSVTI